jgi:hypothetical protein
MQKRRVVGSRPPPARSARDGRLVQTRAKVGRPAHMSYKYVPSLMMLYINVGIDRAPCSIVRPKARPAIALRPSGRHEYDAQTRSTGRLSPAGWRPGSSHLFG